MDGEAGVSCDLDFSFPFIPSSPTTFLSLFFFLSSFFSVKKKDYRYTFPPSLLAQAAQDLGRFTSANTFGHWGLLVVVVDGGG